MEKKAYLFSLALACVFMLLAKPSPAKADAEIDFYGYIRLDSVYNTSRLSSPITPLYAKAIEDGGSKEGTLYMNPRLSGVGLRAKGPNPTGFESFELGARMEIDFHNGGRDSRQLIRMRHAYAFLKMGQFQILFGQTWHTVSRLYPAGATTSLIWMGGNTGDRAPQVRLTLSDSNKRANFQIDASIHMQNAVDSGDSDGDAILNGPQASFPGLQGRAALGVKLWSKQELKLAFGAHAGMGRYKLDAVDKDVTSFGLFLEVVLPIYDGYFIQGEMYKGSNVSDLRGGSGQGISTAGEEIESMGYWVELVALPTSWLKLSLGTGEDNPDNSVLDSGARTLNQTVWGLIHVRPWKNFRVGFEWTHFQTSFVGSKKVSAEHVVSHLTYYF
ncbi:MAG: hypothetical protein HOI23_02135 [Deltaproteobacteria bacterium]|jgi:hypothetical protein|nr:hypothetical protein [Deltaproteobacteria bacterium]MBT6436207.1 hypothetical protein [Deltaproteobacteria bacterium]